MDLFSPIDNSKYCNLFWAISVITFVFSIISLVASVTFLFYAKYRNQSLVAFLFAVKYFVFYVIFRVFYSMCITSMPVKK